MELIGWYMDFSRVISINLRMHPNLAAVVKHEAGACLPDETNRG